MEEVSAEGISSCGFRFFCSVVTRFELCFLLPVFAWTLWTWRKPPNCLWYNPKGETQVTGKVINPHYRSSLLFLMNISKTFITWLEGRKQKLVRFLSCVTITDCKKIYPFPYPDTALSQVYVVGLWVMSPTALQVQSYFYILTKAIL